MLHSIFSPYKSITPSIVLFTIHSRFYIPVPKATHITYSHLGTQRAILSQWHLNIPRLKHASSSYPKPNLLFTHASSYIHSQELLTPETQSNNSHSHNYLIFSEMCHSPGLGSGISAVSPCQNKIGWISGQAIFQGKYLVNTSLIFSVPGIFKNFLIPAEIAQQTWW